MQLSAVIGGVRRTDYFRFPDGYDPEELIRCGAGQAVFDADIKPRYDSLPNVAVDFPYTDVKT